MAKKRGDSLDKKTQIAIVSRGRILRESLCSVLNANDRYHCIEVDPSNRESYEFPIRDTALHILNYNTTDTPDKPYFKEVIYPITTDTNTKSLLILPYPQIDLESAIRIGSDGCISLNDSLEETQNGIEQILSGTTYLSPSLTQSLYEGIRRRKTKETSLTEDANLTRREIEIIKLIQEELTNKEIAKQLHISVYTVKNHVHNLIEKLGVKNRHEASKLMN